jgi:outer membrane protein assembly factor BamB
VVSLRGLVLGLSLWIGMGVAATPASGGLRNVPDTTWMTNGEVRAVAQYGGVIWIAGQFTQLRERSPGQGGRVIPVANLAAIGAKTGAPVPGLKMPAVKGGTPIVYALRVADGRLFIGGSFTSVAGRNRSNLAALNAATGALVKRFKPQIGTVWSLAANATRLYAGGAFSVVNGMQRLRLAAFFHNGTLDPSWSASTDDRPRDMAVSGQSLFVVGHFNNVAGPDGVWKPRDSVARFSLATGDVLQWVAGCPCSTQLFGMGVDVVEHRVYVGMGGSDWVGAYDRTSGAQIWRTDTNGQVQDVEAMGDRLIVAGHYTYVAPAPGQQFNCYSNPGACVRRSKLSALTLDGRLTGWNPEMTGDYDGVWRVHARGSRLHAVGEFLGVSGVRQQKVARFTAR